MKKKMIKYPKTRQFRNIVSSINRVVNYVGKDDKGEPIYDPSIPKPTLTFKGTVKLHGQNAGVSYNTESGIYTQSRNHSFDITEQPDSHNGFTFFVKERKSDFLEFFDDIYISNGISPREFTATIYGEWAGKGTQTGVAISNIEKSFFIFGVKISKPNDPDHTSYWVDYSNLRKNDKRIYNIDDFKTYSIDIDFNMPGLAQNKLAEITNEVEAECPVAKEFGHLGIGEGVVWSTEYVMVSMKNSEIENSERFSDKLQDYLRKILPSDGTFCINIG